jgi:hypothetical protein
MVRTGFTRYRRHGFNPTAGIYANATIERCGRLLLEQLHVDLAAPA